MMIQNGKEYYYQVEQIKYTASTPASTLIKEFPLSTSYKRCIGVALYPHMMGGLPYFRIGIADNNQDYINNIPQKALESAPEAGVRAEERFVPLHIKAEGHVIKIRTEMPQELSSDLMYDLVFLLEREPAKR